MIPPADPRPDVDGLVEYRVDADAAPGNVIPALARLPELGQGMMTRQLSDLLRAVLETWEGPLPRLHYVTDAGNHPLEFYAPRANEPGTGHRLHNHPIASFSEGWTAG